MPFLIIRDDITNVCVDAIVNAANCHLKQGGGVCGDIFRVAGADRLQAACDRLAPIKTGEAVITDGFDSKADYIIHTAGPVYEKGNPHQEQQLYSCYHNSLSLAAEKHLASIAFPLISAGIYRYPPEQALSIAVRAIHDFLGSYEGNMTVYMVFYDKAFAAAKKMYDQVEDYIDAHLVDRDELMQQRNRYERSLSRERRAWNAEEEEDDEIVRKTIKPISSVSFHIQLPPKKSVDADSVDDFFEKLEDSFNKRLFKFIRAKNMSNVDVYKNANIDRRLFSKIISNEKYAPNKNTILALSISLRLNLDETKALLGSAGYALSHSSKADLVVEYYITHHFPSDFNIYDLNFLLFTHDLEQLGQV